MPRDSAGNYSLVAGNPVVSNTVIESVWANTTMDDIATALTDSLDRQGRGGMLAPFRFADGTQLLPGQSWVNETNSGFYLAGPQDWRAVVSASDAMRWVDDGAGNAKTQIFDYNDSLWKDVATTSSTVPLVDGDIDNPSLTWVNDLTDGWYRAGAHDQRYVQDVGAVQTDIFRFVDGVAEVQIERWDNQQIEWVTVVGERLTLSQHPVTDDNGSKVADTNFVRKWANAIAQGVGDGNSSTFLGAPFGAATWVRDAAGLYTLTLSTALSNVNNAVVSVGILESVATAPFKFTYEVNSTTSIEIRIFNQAGARADPDAISFEIKDTGLH